MDYVLVRDYFARNTVNLLFCTLFCLFCALLGIYGGGQDEPVSQRTVYLLMLFFVLFNALIGIFSFTQAEIARTTRWLPAVKNKQAKALWFFSVLIPVSMAVIALMMSLGFLKDLEFTLDAIVLCVLMSSLVFILITADGDRKKLRSSNPLHPIRWLFNLYIALCLFAGLVYLCMMTGWIVTGILGAVALCTLYVSYRRKERFFEKYVERKYEVNRKTGGTREIRALDKILGTRWGFTAISAFLVLFMVLLMGSICYFFGWLMSPLVPDVFHFTLIVPVIGIAVLFSIESTFQFICILRIYAALPVSRQKICTILLSHSLCTILPVLLLVHILFWLFKPEMLAMSLIISLSFLFFLLSGIATDLHFKKRYGKTFPLALIIPATILWVENDTLLYYLLTVLFSALAVAAVFFIYRIMTQSSEPFRKRNPLFNR